MQLTKNQELYKDLTLYFALELHNKADEPIIELQNQQKENRDTLLNELAKILLEFKIIDSSMSLTPVDRIKLYSKLEKMIEDSFKSELKTENARTKDILLDTTKEKLSIDNYIYSLGSDSKLTKMSDEILDKIINEKIDGEIWSNRLWSNKIKLKEELKTKIMEFLKGKINVNEISGLVKEKYNSNATNCSRLIRTEVAKVQSGVNEYYARAKGIEQQLFVATLDNRTSKICQNFDGTVWDIDDADKPIPPKNTHPNCRSCLVSLVSSDWRPSKRMDNITKENINWQTYTEWKKKQKQES
jgi:SPP1 gp7 family putative phage head morphogenesis protein